MKWRVAVHGGAWSIPDHLLQRSLNGVQDAVAMGAAVLKDAGSALDAVEKAVRCMEDNPAFDAGRGSALNASEFVEMDAMIMDGSSLKAGSVAAITSVHNPVSVARRVMEKTPHVLIVSILCAVLIFLRLEREQTRLPEKKGSSWQKCPT